MTYPSIKVGSRYWRQPVANFASLPTGETVGEIRLVISESTLYQWDGSTWGQLVTGGSITQSDSVVYVDSFGDEIGTSFGKPYTYNNGTAGVGATITSSINVGIGTVGGVILGNGDIVCITNQAANGLGSYVNGVYVVTDAGSGSTPFILTRASDYNEVSEIFPSVVVVQGGDSVNLIYRQTVDLVTIGTDDILFSLVTTSQAQLDAKADNEAFFTTSTTVTFLVDTYHGSLGSPLSGNITVDVTGAIRGPQALVAHNDATPPVVSSAVLHSGTYEVGRNNLLQFWYDGGANYSIIPANA